MDKNLKPFLLISFLVVATIFLVFYGMALAKGVLGPIFLAIILAMVLTPVCNFLERHGFKKGWAAFSSTLIFIAVILGILLAVGAEAKKLAQNSASIKDRLSTVYGDFESFVENNSSYNIQNPFEGAQLQKSQHNEAQNDVRNTQQTNKETGNISGSNASNTNASSTSLSNIKNIITTALSSIFSSLTTLLIIIVYLFFMLLHRQKFEKGVLYFMPEDKREEGKAAIADILEDAQQYLFGHVILIIALTTFYTIGFSIAGMKGAFTTALLAAVLTLVPYVGTLVGDILAIGIAFITTGNMSAIWIVIATVAIGQFIESYFLEPYIVGKRMNVNPLFTILSVTVGAAVWGIIGMIVFLPLFSFVKAITDHVPMLRPVGYFIGKEDISDGKPSKWKKKIKNLFK